MAAALVLALVISSGPASIVQAQAGCRFVLGFATLGAMIGADTVGACRENQRSAPNGDAWQATIKGQMVWRKVDNRTVFTDGYRTWLYGPVGLQQRLNTERYVWEGDVDAAGTTTIDPPPLLPTGAAVLGMFVPCTTIGRSYFDAGSFNTEPEMFFFECASSIGPTVLQTIDERATNALASTSFASTIVDTLDPQSIGNQFPGFGTWFEIPSAALTGSRAFKRQIVVPSDSRQIEVFTVQARYIVGVVQTFPFPNDGKGENTPARATEILTTLLARIPN